MLRLVHTSDLHIGMEFSAFPAAVARELGSRRAAVLDSIASLVREQPDVDVVLVGGDLFDGERVGDAAVEDACLRIREIERPVFVLPGCHDPADGPTSVYGRPAFRDNRPDNLILLADRRPRLLKGDGAVLLPAPVCAPAGGDDATAHFDSDLGRELAAYASRIALVHGCLGERATADGAAQPCAATNVVAGDCERRAGLDYLALGGWHGVRSEGRRSWYAGSPEPTGFAPEAQGELLLTTIKPRARRPVVDRVPVGRTTWARCPVELGRPDGPAALAAWCESLPKPADTVVSLDLGGVQSRNGELGAVIERMRGDFLHVVS